MVLGMECLRNLGQISADFPIPSISFDHDNNNITLRGDPPKHLTPSTFHQLFHLINTNSVALIQLLTFAPTPTLSHPQANPATTTITHLPDTIPQDIQTVRQRYPTIFKAPHGLPPPCPHDH